ncbi:hypothetical protein [Bryobacter aggregatus]|uniref:hypothetical protein n=1 Tax=Bryobacter aggregatus TaxID=360054 RepID=UPI0004E1F384|nr:hypothetical protein [Bryobacter aggregatus]
MLFRRSTLPLLAAMICGAATLEQLSTDRLINESTEIVRGTVNYCNYLYRPPVIWTVCEVNVKERLKGSGTAKVQVAIPGGVASGYRQSIEGTPSLERNTEYLLFLWQGKSGLKQIMGLSQGLLGVTKDANGELVANRTASHERMLNARGQRVEDHGIRMKLSEITAKLGPRTR